MSLTKTSSMVQPYFLLAPFTDREQLRVSNVAGADALERWTNLVSTRKRKTEKDQEVKHSSLESALWFSAPCHILLSD